MKILIVAATPYEIMDFRKYVDTYLNEFIEQEYYFDFLITGIGLTATAFHLGQYLANYEVDVAIQAGVAGSYRTNIELCQMVRVDSEAFGDLGAEDNDNLLDIFETGLVGINDDLFENKLLFASEKSPLNIGLELRKVHGITVNMVAGNENTIAYRRKKFAADIETMEGAAFHYACLHAKVPFLHLRCISNFVAPRDKTSWRLKGAIDNLNSYLVKSFDNILS